MDPAALAAPRPLTAHRRTLGALTGLRFFAAFHVVLFHSRLGQSLSDAGFHAAGDFFRAGHLAVVLFFLLSGFILAYTYQGQIETRADHIRFWQARFARIWPAYAVSLLACTLQSGLVPRLPVALATLAMVQAWNPWNPSVAGAWNLVCWTLSAEAFFYLLFPASQVRLERLAPRALLLASLLLLTLCALTNSGMKDLGFAAHGLFRYLPLPVIHLPEFLAGVCLGNLFLARQTHPHPATPSTGLWTYTATVATVAILCLPEGRWTSLVVTSFAALVYNLAAEITLLSRLLATPLLVFGGGISYSIYLFQIPVKAWSADLFTRLGLANSWTRLSATAAALILLASAVFLLVENPARRAIRFAFAAWDQRHAPGPNPIS